MQKQCEFINWNIADNFGVECTVCGKSFDTLTPASKMNELRLFCDNQKIISSCGQVSEKEQETNEQRVQRLMKGQRGRSQDREGLTGEQIGWLTPSGAVMSDSCFQFLTPNEKAQCKPYYGASSQPNKQTLTDEGSRYDELEKQVVELLGVTGQPNVLSVIKYVKILQSK